MKKALLAGIAVAFVAVLVILGWLFFKQVENTDPNGTNTSSSVSDRPLKKTELTAVPMPTIQADVYDNLDYGIQKNKDTVGWINIPNTDINNFVMQGDDNDFYLRRDENKEYDVYGCYFLDYECTLGAIDDFSLNTVIYGHSELTDDPDGNRFAQLYRFLDEDFAKENKSIFISTQDGNFEFEIISVFYPDLRELKYTKVFITEQEALALEKSAISQSVMDYGITPALGDKLLTLSTCTTKFEDAENHRFVVMGRLVGAV